MLKQKIASPFTEKLFKIIVIINLLTKRIQIYIQHLSL